MLRRSSSSSHIPVLKNDTQGGRPKSSFGANSAKKIRASSCDRLPVVKRSTSSLSSFKRPQATTTPTLSSSTSKSPYLKKLSETTPIQGLALFKRSPNISTAASSRSSSRSPCRIGSERTPSDKKWVAQQFAKVRRFLEEHTSCQDYIPDIKYPTINTFVFVMDLLLKEIDPRIELNTTNYKEVLLNKLKILHYPGNISNSLLKTVNTTHAWPQVISIFSWLVDLIVTIRCVDSPVNVRSEEDRKDTITQCITDYIVDRYKSYNGDFDTKVVDEKFEEEFANILNVDSKEVELLEQEVNTLSELNQQKSENITDQNKKIDDLQKETESLQNEIDKFYSHSEENQEDIKWTIELLKARREKLVESIKERRNNKELLNEAIKTQPCTIEEKKRMMTHIEELKHAIDLKKDKIKEQQNLKNDWEMKIMEAKKKVEKEVYRLNSNVMKLVILEPELKDLHLKEQNMFLPCFREEVQNLIKKLHAYDQELKCEISQTKQAMSKMKTEMGTLEEHFKETQKTIQTLVTEENCIAKEIETYQTNREIKSKEREERVNDYLTKIKELEEIGINIDSIKEEHNRLIVLKNKKELEFENLKEQSLQFFIKLHKVIKTNFLEMNEIRTDIFNMLSECLSKMDAEQGNIIEELGKLAPILDQEF